MKKILTAFRSLSIRKKLFICIVVISLAPQCVLVASFFETSRSTLTETTKDNINQLVLVNNEIINHQMRIVRESTMNILVDNELYRIVSAAAVEGAVDRMITEKEIRDVLTKYFGSLDCVEQVDLITNGYTYAMKTRLAQYQNFFTSEPFRRIAEKKGGIEWLTKSDMADYHLGDGNLSCARVLNLTHVGLSGIGTPLPRTFDRPVIRVQFSDAFFTERLGKNTANLTEARFMLVDKEGNTQLEGGEYRNFVMQPEWLETIKTQRSGMLEIRDAQGAQSVICFDQISQTGWISIVAFSVNALAGRMTQGLYATFVGVVCIQILTSLLASLLAISMITRRIRQIDRGIDSLKTGDFKVVVEDSRRDEFTHLVDNFNDMSRTLRQLIDENYKVRLSEQDARLQTLMMQLNPHYLYNTLNVINWVALREHAKKSSSLIVSLSRMLRYTSDNRRDRTLLRDDIEWLEQYIVLMQARFEGLFTVSWDVEPELLEARLPKLFMQPLLENSILHGFSDRKTGGEIRIRIRQEGSDAVAEVADNGVGMSPERIEQVLGQAGASIGIYNIHKRLQLMYGESYGLSIKSGEGQGCAVRIRMQLKQDVIKGQESDD